MPFERFDGSRERSRNASARRMHVFRKLKIPAFATIGSLVAFALWEQSFLTRNVGGLSSFAPDTNVGWQSYLPAYSFRLGAADSGTGQSDDFWDDFDADFDDLDGTGTGAGGFQAEAVAESWDPFVPNTAPLTEITAKSCMWPPTVYDTCMPDSSAREDAEKGKWIRVEKDMNLRVGVYYNYLFYRRLQRKAKEAATVREFRLLTDKEHSARPLASDDGWHRISQNLRAGIWPSQEAAHLYYRTAPRSDRNITDEVTELDIVWGSGGTLYGWDRLGRTFSEPKEKSKFKDTDEGAELMWRKGNPMAPQAPLPLAFSQEGQYKIMQIADLHFSVGRGKCRDSDWTGCEDARGSDFVTLGWLGEVLDAEKPDMVILSGDQLNGQDTSYSSESVLLKVAKLFEKRKIPWAAVMGNHDSEKTTLTRYGQFVMMQALPYFVGEPGPIEVDGEGNYFIKLVSADETRSHLFSLYFLDSHANIAKVMPWDKGGYDYMKKSQVDWYKSISNTIKPVQRPFIPPVLENSTFDVQNDLEGDGSDDDRMQTRPEGEGDNDADVELAVRSEGASRRRTKRVQRRQDASGTTLAKPNALAIFHIPLAEVYDLAPDMDAKSGSPLVYGVIESGRGAAHDDKGHFFRDGIMAQTELGPRTEVGQNEVDDDPDYAAAILNAKPEIKVVINGHCHVSDQCARLNGVWNCFAGGSSYSGYSEVGFDRRVRVIQLEDFGETIRTYKLLDTHSDTTRWKTDNPTISNKGDNGEEEDGGDDASAAAAEKGMEQRIELEKAAFAAEAGLKRQVPGQRPRVDELILVGKGAPQ